MSSTEFNTTPNSISAESPLTSTQIDWPRRIGLFACLAFSIFCLWKTLPFSSAPPEAAKPVMATIVTPKAITAVKRSEVATRPIQNIEVGQRVLANNPEITDQQRRDWGAEPDFSQWLHLKLEMPKQDGGILHIDLLRPEEWVRSKLGFVVHESEVTPQTPSDADRYSSEQPAPVNYDDLPSIPLSPLRPVYRDLSLAVAAFDFADADLAGLTVEMDLPEMGAMGTALVTDMQPVSRAETGEGSVVTATFRHPASSTVLDVSFVSQVRQRDSASESDAESIGVTENHLFWSVDRQEFRPIGEMEIGERVQTFHGETKRLASKLPRPGPAEAVYNLEVYGEHVYFISEQRLLAHNACLEARGRAYKEWKRRRNITGRPTLEQFSDFTSRNTTARRTGLRHYVTTHGYAKLESRVRRAFRITEHHLLTNKNGLSTAAGGPYTPIFEEMAQAAGVALDDPLLRIDVVGHFGPHPEANRITFERLISATQHATDYQSAFFAEIVRLRRDSVTPGSQLNRAITGGL